MTLRPALRVARAASDGWREASALLKQKGGAE